MKAFEKRCSGIALIDDYCADLGRVVTSREFSGKAFVEGERGGFGGGVVGHVRDCDVSCEGGDGDDHAVIMLDHCGHEFFGHPIVS